MDTGKGNGKEMCWVWVIGCNLQGMQVEGQNEMERDKKRYKV